MTHSYVRHAALCLVVGVAVAAAGVLCSSFSPIRAAAVDRTEGLLMATGTIDNDLEHVTLLDTLSGDLTLLAINPQTGKFFAKFDAKVPNDLQLDVSKNPKYLLNIGSANLRTQGQQQFGQCVVYVADASSGVLGAYAVPFNRASLNSRVPVAGQLLFLDRIQFRTALVR